MPCEKCNEGDEFNRDSRVQFMTHVKSVNFDEFGNPCPGRVNVIKTWSFCSQDCLDEWYATPAGVFEEPHVKDAEADQNANAPVLHEEDLNLAMLAWQEKNGIKSAVDYATFDTTQDLNTYWNEAGLPDKPQIEQALVDALPPIKVDADLLGLLDGKKV